MKKTPDIEKKPEIRKLPDIRKSPEKKKMPDVKQFLQPLFVEPQYTDLSAKTLSRETGSPVWALDPIVTGPADHVPLDYYESVMLKNMEVLISALSGSGESR